LLNFLKNRPKDLGDGSYKDWSEGELGYAPTTGTIALSNNAGPMKWGENAKDGTQRAMTLAREFAETPMEVIDMVYKYKKAQCFFFSACCSSNNRIFALNIIGLN